MTMRYENFSNNFGAGESVIVNADEYLRVESEKERVGAVWTSQLSASQTFEALSDLLGKRDAETSGHIVVEELDGSRWETDGTTEDIKIFAREEPDRIVSVVLDSGFSRLRWARPELRIKSAVKKTAEIGLLADPKVFRGFASVLSSTATAEIHKNPTLVTSKVRQLRRRDATTEGQNLDIS
ncbi:hypothetical protein IV500_18150 [Paeniglutamicibacter antarcticus]|uniref:Uncharacterized protein n=1 Tax=Arthrobacter terrae TaxID=2935737 RepID=A0A931CS90_9MICC|nr:hypothetical protein [Arthrobacter terrae]MBG0741291.1 hypothetical protein [Arthrobacter terrae]